MNKVIKKTQNAVLLEQEERGYMFYVPSDVYDSTEDKDKNYLEDSIPYSLNFLEIILEILQNSDIEAELYKRGIHTLDDLLNRQQAVNDVLRKYISSSTMIKVVKNKGG